MTKAKLRKLLTKPKFRAWLEAKKPRVVVGLGKISSQCPIAKYLESNLGERVSTGRCGIYVFVLGRYINDATPRWCWGFMDSVDVVRGKHITASRALKILDGIK